MNQLTLQTASGPVTIDFQARTATTAGAPDAPRPLAEFGLALSEDGVLTVGTPSARDAQVNQYRSLPGVIKSVDGDRVGGYASFLSTDRHRELVLPASFEKWLPVFKKHPVMLLGHNSDASEVLPIGSFAKLSIRNDGLEVEGSLMKEHPQYPSIRAAVAAGLMAWSIGFYPKSGRPADDAEKARHGADLEWVWEEVELLEISLVTIGSNRDTLAALKAMAVREARHDIDAAERVQAIRMMNDLHRKVNGLVGRLTFGRKEFQAHMDTIMSACSTFCQTLQDELNGILGEMGDDTQDPNAPADGKPPADGTPPAAPPADGGKAIELAFNDLLARASTVLEPHSATTNKED